MTFRLFGNGTAIVVLFLAFTVLSGCGPRFAQTEFVEGTVTLDGSPVSGASISFTLVEEESTVFASGETGENGVYRLTMYPDGAADKGTVSGRYEVAIRKQESRIIPVPKTDPETSDDKIVFTDIVPKKYHRASTSGLTATVVSGNNRIDFQLSSK